MKSRTQKCARKTRKSGGENHLPSNGMIRRRARRAFWGWGGRKSHFRGARHTKCGARACICMRNACISCEMHAFRMKYGVFCLFSIGKHSKMTPFGRGRGYTHRPLSSGQSQEIAPKVYYFLQLKMGFAH